ncbi:MAG: aldo/keto reductase [Clostridiales bacterium]|jgi:aryl-alcohol dehydrogenase-like predicted oxidoreductase|nr:aldo/keto reductase [Clostridiales bacterium]
METVSLGRTGLRATIAGLGCGGHSRIGFATHGQDHAAGIVRAAYDAGVNFFDTAVAYGTEGAVGQGLAGLPRESYILSTKYPYARDPDWRKNGAAALTRSLDESLRALRADYIDIYHLHGLSPEDYADARDVFLPAMRKAKEQGKIRFPGVTEVFALDTSHKMLQAALPEDHFDVIMTGYNILNPSAAKTVLKLTTARGTGVLCMFAVRSALSDPAQLKIDIGRILERGQAGEGLSPAEDALDFLTSGETPAASTVMEAAYRFCRHTPGIHVTLTGTGNPGHLRDNLRSIAQPPLPPGILARLEALFGRVDCISGQ